jgi:hypothetical protein
VYLPRFEIDPVHPVAACAQGTRKWPSTLAISGFKRPEIALVATGASADVLGVGLDKVDSSQMTEVLDAFPRLAFKREFVRSCADVVQRYPQSAPRTFMRDIGERQVTSFQVKNICDFIEHAPFAE